MGSAFGGNTPQRGAPFVQARATEGMQQQQAYNQPQPLPQPGQVPVNQFPLAPPIQQRNMDWAHQISQGLIGQQKQGGGMLGGGGNGTPGVGISK
jgi:hypothetical protein